MEPPSSNDVHTSDSPVATRRGNCGSDPVHLTAVLSYDQKTRPCRCSDQELIAQFDVERQGDLLGDSRTAPVGITLLHFDDRMNKSGTRSSRAGLPTAIRGGGRTKSAIQPARMRSYADSLGDRCRERFTISPDCVFDASEVPETCLELSGFANLMWDSIRRAKADN
jgi:hypothetical protein